MKKIIQDFLAIFDIKVVRASNYKILNFSDKKISPISIPYYSNIQPSLVELDCDLGRTNRWFDLSQNSIDPHYYAIKIGINEGLSGNDLVKRITNILEINRNMSKSENAADQFGISDSMSKLRNYPFWAEVLPWETFNIDEAVKKTPLEVKKNRALHNLVIKSNEPDDIMKIDYDEYCNSHAQQYEKLFSSIKKRGFLKSQKYGFINAEILLKDGNYRWKPGRDGNHRSVLLAAMGMKKIPLIISKFIRYEEVEFWPNVLNQTFTKIEAKKIFNQIFHATPPRFYSRWIDYCNRSSDKTSI